MVEGRGMFGDGRVLSKAPRVGIPIFLKSSAIDRMVDSITKTKISGIWETHGVE
jgi:hypothetical protein